MQVNDQPCFNARCGFVVYSHDIPIDFVVLPITDRGHSIHFTKVSVYEVRILFNVIKRNLYRVVRSHCSVQKDHMIILAQLKIWIWVNSDIRTKTLYPDNRTLSELQIRTFWLDLNLNVRCLNLNVRVSKFLIWIFEILTELCIWLHLNLIVQIFNRKFTRF